MTGSVRHIRHSRPNILTYKNIISTGSRFHTVWTNLYYTSYI